MWSKALGSDPNSKVEKKVAGAAMHIQSVGLWLLYCLSCLRVKSDMDRELEAIDKLG